MYHGDILTKFGGIMFTYKRLITFIILLMILVNFSFSAPLSGTYNVGSGQTYTSLTGSGAAGFFKVGPAFQHIAIDREKAKKRSTMRSFIKKEMF